MVQETSKSGDFLRLQRQHGSSSWSNGHRGQLLILLMALLMLAAQLFTNLSLCQTVSLTAIPDASNDRTLGGSVELDVCASARASKSSATFFQSYGQCSSPDWAATQTMKRNDGNLTLSTVVPALKQNKEILMRLMESIARQTVPPDEVIVAMSDLGTVNENSFCESLLKDITNIVTKAPVKLICIGEKMLTSRARNLGSMSSTSELVSLMDADDIEYPIRNEVSKNVFECRGRNLKLFLHAFVKKMEEIPPAIPDGYKCAEEDTGVGKLTGPQLYDLLADSHERLWLHKTMHHGWPVVHRSVFNQVMWSPLNGKEDALFVRSVLYTFGPKVETAFYLNRPLGFYLQASESYRANN